MMLGIHLQLSAVNPHLLLSTGATASYVYQTRANILRVSIQVTDNLPIPPCRVLPIKAYVYSNPTLSANN